MKLTYFEIGEMTPSEIVVTSNSPLFECGSEDVLRFTNKIIEDDYKEHGDVHGRERTISIEIAYPSGDKPYPFNIDTDGHLNISLGEDDQTSVTGEGTKKITVKITK